MTIKEHKQRHAQLHKALEELVFDFYAHTERSPGSLLIEDLLIWARDQARKPTPWPRARYPKSKGPHEKPW